MNDEPTTCATVNVDATSALRTQLCGTTNLGGLDSLKQPDSADDQWRLVASECELSERQMIQEIPSSRSSSSTLISQIGLDKGERNSEGLWKQSGS